MYIHAVLWKATFSFVYHTLILLFIWSYSKLWFVNNMGYHKVRTDWMYHYFVLWIGLMMVQWTETCRLVCSNDYLYIYIYIYIYTYIVFWLNKLLYHDISSVISVPIIKELHLDLTGNRNTFLGRPAPGLLTISVVPPSVTKVPLCNQAQFSAVTVMDLIIDNESHCWPLKTGSTQSLT